MSLPIYWLQVYGSRQALNSYVSLCPFSSISALFSSSPSHHLSPLISCNIKTQRKNRRYRGGKLHGEAQLINSPQPAYYAVSLSRPALDYRHLAEGLDTDKSSVSWLICVADIKLGSNNTTRCVWCFCIFLGCCQTTAGHHWTCRFNTFFVSALNWLLIILIQSTDLLKISL